MNKIITGEKIQQLCDVYFGFQSDFDFNPNIKDQKNKQFELKNLYEDFYNPRYIYCYSNRIDEFSNKIHLLKNDFILFTGNSDGEIRNTDDVLVILNCEKLLKWYGQNVCFESPKLNLMPIGIANSQWLHGNLNIFNNEEFMKNLNSKNKKVYFNFKIETNKEKRDTCYDSLKNKLEWLNKIEPTENLARLKEYEFCICPEGNGVDTHRLWESLYLKTVPIVIQSEFTNILKKNNVPLVILNNWNDFDEKKLNYDDYNLNEENLLKLIDFETYRF